MSFCSYIVIILRRALDKRTVHLLIVVYVLGARADRS